MSLIFFNDPQGIPSQMYSNQHVQLMLLPIKPNCKNGEQRRRKRKEKNSNPNPTEPGSGEERYF
jgi:hypothetical protein